MNGPGEKTFDRPVQYAEETSNILRSLSPREELDMLSFSPYRRDPANPGTDNLIAPRSFWGNIGHFFAAAITFLIIIDAKCEGMSVERYNKTWQHFSGLFTNNWWDMRRFGVNPAGMWPYQAEP